MLYTRSTVHITHVFDVQSHHFLTTKFTLFVVDMSKQDR